MSVVSQLFVVALFFFFQAEDGIRDLVRSRGLGDVYKRQALAMLTGVMCIYVVLVLLFKDFVQPVTILAALVLSLIHI